MAFQLNSGIPLSINQPDYVNTLARSDQARAARAEEGQRNALRDFMQENGAAVYAGDENALGQFARYDPQAALGIKSQYAQMRANEERLKLARAAGARAAANAKLSREEAARAKMEYDQLRTLAMMRQSDPEGFQQGLNTLGLAQQGVTPDTFDLYLATAQGAASEIFKGVQETTPSAKGPLSNIGKIQADINAGILPADTPLRGQSNDGMSFTLADGTVIRTGAGANSIEDSKIDASSTGAMIDSINGILDDPALESATGILSMTQAIPGTPMYRFGTRVKQLQGQAFLQAFEGLKGGGQITEIEGTKATEAIGRLDSAQSAEDYRGALNELKGILIDAINRPRGWSDTDAGRISVMGSREIENLDLMLLDADGLEAARLRLLELKAQGQ